MSSTKEDALSEMIGSLFDEVLMPMAQRMRERGAQPFPLKPDVSWLSYYVRRARCSMTRDDFTAPSCADFDDFDRRLTAHWQSLGRLELAEHVPRIAGVARAAHAAFALDKQDGEVDPYIYVMF